MNGMKSGLKYAVLLFAAIGIYFAWSEHKKSEHIEQIKLINDLYTKAQELEKQGNWSDAQNYYSSLCQGVESGIQREDLPAEACNKSLYTSAKRLENEGNLDGAYSYYQSLCKLTGPYTDQRITSPELCDKAKLKELEEKIRKPQ